MSTQDQFIANPPKAFFTDVFGTIVNWRKTVAPYLNTRAHEALNSASASIPSHVREIIDVVSWDQFAQKWRDSYYHFVRNYDPTTMPFKTIDEHHAESLRQLVREHAIEGLWNEDELDEISLIWHRLEPWPDSAAGLEKLSQKFITATLSNANRKLLEDLVNFGHLSYTRIVSAEEFRAYKPDPSVYLGAAHSLPQVAPSECCLIAAHLSDLKAAKECGFRTVFIERANEESYSQAQIALARSEGVVDVWISADKKGMITLANMLDS